MKPETIAIHTAQPIDPATGAIVPPIVLSTTFERAPDGTFPADYEYARDNNPNREALEKVMMKLEQGTKAFAWASGSVAMMSVFQALSPNDHVLAPTDLYHGIRVMLLELFVPWGLSVDFVDMTDLNAVEETIRPETRLLVLESPSNPQMLIANISALADLAHANNAYLVVDNTIATPIFQTPLTLGADFVVHATTKYLGGHSDVMGGMLVAREHNPIVEKLEFIRTIGGAIPAPFSCWLTLRGIQTLAHRMRFHAENAQTIAEHLESHSAIEAVLYPGLSSHPSHSLANQQMSGFSGVLSVLVKGGSEKALSIIANLQVILRATSFGGTHTLVEHRASIPNSTAPDNLLRFSIGLEHVDDLIADLHQALDK